MKNWRTSIFGALILASQLGTAVGIPPRAANVITAVCAALGLNEAKDKNVTGGTIIQ